MKWLVWPRRYPSKYGSNLFVVTISPCSRLYLPPQNLRYAVNGIIFLIPDGSPVIFGRAFGQAADRAREFVHPRFDVCKASGYVTLLLLLLQNAPEDILEIEDKEYFMFLRCSTLKNLPMKKENIMWCRRRCEVRFQIWLTPCSEFDRFPLYRLS